MNRASPLSKLESLNHDVRLEILGACDSFEDLAALIRASPTFFHTFLSNKASLLVLVVGNILGPATRDAALLEKTSLDHRNDFYRQVDEVVYDYKAHLRVGGPPWVTGLDAETAIALTHITRLTQFCVDIFGYFQCRQFWHDMDPTEGGAIIPGGPRLSRNERIRIAQAILRRQVLVLISRSGYEEYRDWPRVIRKLLPLFRTWEWQQISDMDRFLAVLYQWLAYDCGHHIPFLVRSQEGNLLAPDLGPFVRALKSALTCDYVPFDDIFESWVFRRKSCFYVNPMQFLAGSHWFGTPLYDDSQHLNTSGDDGDSSLEPDIDDQPWAWRDALRGYETCRWGFDLLEIPARGTDLRQAPSPDPLPYGKLQEALEFWRSYGMVFWDRERVERLKQMSALKMCQTGWLIPVARLNQRT